MINVLIADDHKLVRQGMRAFLTQDLTIRVVGEAADGEEALARIKELKPDIVLLDISMPKLNGLLTLNQIPDLQVKTKAIMVSMYLETALIQQIIQSGAKGYILKSSAMEELIDAIKTVHNGKVYFSPDIMQVLVDQFKQPEKKVPADLVSTLTQREIEILQLISEGETNYGIAAKLNIGVKTVEKHRSTVMSKLNIHNTAGLVKFAIKNGLVLEL